MSHKWYPIKVQSGKEFPARDALLRKVEEDEMQEKIQQVVVPVYKNTVFKNGKKTQVELKRCPGYIYLYLDYNDEMPYYIKQSPYIGGFVVSGRDETPHGLDESELDFLQSDSNKEEKTEVDLDIGQKIVVIDGPFSNFSGNIEGFSSDKKKVFIKIEIFGRTTPVEIDYFKLKKI